LPLAVSAEQEHSTMHPEPSFFAEPKNWVMLAFFLFFILFGKKLWSVLAAILDARAVSVKAELEEASRLRREAEAMLRDAEKQRADALADAKSLIEGARAEAVRLTAAAEKAAVDDVRLAAADIATTAARQVLAEGLTADADSLLIDHAITQLPAALAARRAA
jgi:F-type H+-transporting ATPase subunit b